MACNFFTIFSSQSNFSRAIRGCGRQKIGTIANLGAYYLVGIPCGILLAFFYHFGGKVIIKISFSSPHFLFFLFLFCFMDTTIILFDNSNMICRDSGLELLWLYLYKHYFFLLLPFAPIGIKK